MTMPRERLWDWLRLDARRRFPLPDAAFDNIFCKHMIEHFSRLCQKVDHDRI